MKRGEVWRVKFSREVSGRQAKALTDQIATVSKSQLLNKAGHLSKADVEQVEKAVKTQLDL